MIDSALRFPSVHLGGSTTADIPPNSHISAVPSPVGRYHDHTNPVFGDPMVELSDLYPNYRPL